jgi:hypothetical protein
MIDYFPTFIAANRNSTKMLIFGSFMVQAGFEPYQFESHLAEETIDVASINYGVGNLDQESHQYIARQVRRDMNASGQKLDLTLLEFNPLQTTIARGRLGDITRVQNEAILLTSQELWEITLQVPNRGIRLLNIRHLRNGLPAELLSSAFTVDGAGVTGSDEARGLASARRNEFCEAFEAAIPKEVDIFRADYSKELRGGALDKRLLSPEALSALEDFAGSYRDPVFLQADLSRRIAQSDILELGFDENGTYLSFLGLPNFSTCCLASCLGFVNNG